MTYSNTNENNNSSFQELSNISSANNFINESNVPQLNSPQNTKPYPKKKKSIARMRFAPQEDQEILKLVSLYGDKDWNKISSELSKISNNFIQKTPRQCKDRYVNYLSPDIKKGEWTLEEDQCLVHNFVISLLNMKSLKLLLPGRSKVAIKNRIKHLSKFGIGMIKSTINKSMQQNDTNETNFQNININNLLPDSKLNRNLFFNVSDQFYSNQLKSVVTDIFSNSPLVLTAIKDNHLILNPEKNQNDQTKDHLAEDIYNNNLNEFSQFESENDSFDQLYWIDMHM